MMWTTTRIGDHVVKTETRDPRKRPASRFLYIDVSSVDNEAFAIRRPTELLGAEAPSRARKVVKVGDVLFATVRPTLQRIALVGISLDDQICSTAFCVLRAADSLDSKFLYYALLTDFVVEHVRKIEKGVSYPAIRDSDVKAIQIPYPRLPEQRQIAAVLSAVQQAIQRQERLIFLTTELKQALLHKLFTEGTRREPQKQTDIGPMPATWRLEPLGESLSTAQYGISVKGSDRGRIPILRMTNQVDGQVASSDLQFVDISQSEVEKFALLPEDILFNRTNSFELVGRTSIFDLPGTYVFASYLIRLRTHRCKLRPSLLNHYLNWDTTRARLKGIATRAVGQSNISASRLRGFLVALPPSDEQDEICSALDLVGNVRSVHRRRLLSLQELFGSLLQYLMTAQIRVHDLDLSALEATTQEPIGAP